MANKSNKAENEPISLSWTWRLEILDDTLIHGNICSSICINKLLIKRL